VDPGSSTSNSESPATGPAVAPAPAPALAPALPPAAPGLHPPRAGSRGAEPIVPARRGTLPWALIAAVLIVIGVELIIRQFPTRYVVPFSRRDLGYDAATQYIDEQGSAELAFVGSSMIRESISPQVVESRLAKWHAPMTVGNYAVKGANPAEYRLIVKRLLESRHKPRMIVIGVAPSDFLAGPPDYDRLSIYWWPGDWWYAMRRNDGAERVAVWARWPQVLYNTIAWHWRTLRDRDKLVEWLMDRQSIDTSEAGDPVLGVRPRPHGSAIVSGRIRKTHVKRYLASRTKKNGKYNFGTRMQKELAEALAMCRAANVTTVLLEMPLSNLMQTCFPRGTHDAFTYYATTIAADGGARYIPLRDVKWENRDVYFLDSQHLNQGGRDIFSVAATDALLRRNRPARRRPASTRPIGT
jgi:hypothetical protein